MNKFIDSFRLHHEKEDLYKVIENIETGVVFRGTNLWVLTFAIFVASLGLNVNSNAVIIGAMLISPLMGPIIGLGLGMGIHDLSLLKKSAINYFFALLVSLATSTVFFLISPLDKAHSEILARTSPNIYDVLIAFFGGLAGITALASRQKGNVIPGVAIATALMPPLCTAGYGIATWQLHYLFGAFYLFIINTVFIALATFIGVSLLKFPAKALPDNRERMRVNRIVLLIVIITVLPSIYFGYDIVQQNDFFDRADKFVKKESSFKGDYLLKKDIDPKLKRITLIYGGRKLSAAEMNDLKEKLKSYGLIDASLEIRQGFSVLEDIKSNKEFNEVATAIESMDAELKTLHTKLDSLAARDSIKPDTLRTVTSPVRTKLRKRKTKQT